MFRPLKFYEIGNYKFFYLRMQRYCSNSHKYVACWSTSKIIQGSFWSTNYGSGPKWVFKRVENGRSKLIGPIDQTVMNEGWNLKIENSRSGRSLSVRQDRIEYEDVPGDVKKTAQFRPFSFSIWFLIVEFETCPFSSSSL